MNFKFRSLPFVALVALVCSCASTKLENTWKSPAFQGGPMKEIAVLMVDERGMVRQVFEGHTAGELNRRGQSAIQVRELMTLAEIKESKPAAAAKLREAGADSVLIIRLLDASVNPEKYKATTASYTSAVSSYGWFDYYVFAYTGNTMGVDMNRNTQHYYIEYTLYDLASEKRIWSCVTQTNVKYDSDWLELIKPLTTVALDNLAKDGLIR